ncbi:TolB family protein [Ekhidna sp. To15]|uniref:TolB family protein n=1 Tax=Ekhidna sp. To15 TaxID=3395267 RepID=UPI003F526F98
MKNFTILSALLIAFSCSQPNQAEKEATSADSLRYDNEVHLKNVRQLTWGGNNAEAYWSFDGNSLVFQSDFSEWGVECDQIFTMDIADVTKGERPDMVSTGLGRTTCSYFLPGDSLIVYGSTHLADSLCPPVPSRSTGKYVWPIYEGYDIFVANLNGEIVSQLTSDAGYDAEATVSPNGDRIIFTSTRSGDLELYTMNLDGSDVVQLTDELGYDGGAFFSPDGSKIVWRASRPKTDEEITEYTDLLKQGLVQPTEMELYIANADGSEARKITSLGNANWAPFFTPDGDKILFSSNHASERGFPFNLFMVNLDGSELEQVTFDDTFDSFPMFSPDGKYLVWASNRNNGGNRDTNLFVAEWVD